MKTRASYPQTPAPLGCKYCKRQNFDSHGSLIRHQSTGLCGRMKQQEDLRLNANSRPESQASLPPLSDQEDVFLPYFSPLSPPKKHPSHAEEQEEIEQENNNVAMAIGGLFEEEVGASNESLILLSIE